MPPKSKKTDGKRQKEEKEEIEEKEPINIR